MIDRKGETMTLHFQYEPDRILAMDESGRQLAVIMFPTTAGGVVNFTSTFVDPSLRGQGVGDQLVQAAIATIKERGMKAVITCSYVKAWFGKHPEEADLLV